MTRRNDTQWRDVRTLTPFDGEVYREIRAATLAPHSFATLLRCFPLAGANDLEKRLDNLASARRIECIDGLWRA